MQAVEEERQIQELRQLQEETGVAPKRPSRVDFLYEEVGASAEAKAQEHLLGKPVELVPDDSEVKQARPTAETRCLALPARACVRAVRVYACEGCESSERELRERAE